MANAVNLGRLNKTLWIYRAIQLFLMILLVYIALGFQTKLAMEGKPDAFTWGIGIALVIQLCLFWPIKKLSAYEADREIESSRPGLDGTTLKALRNKRLTTDVIKTAVFVFYVVFLIGMPEKKGIAGIVWPVFLSFILTFLTYFQCLAFSLKKAISSN